MKLYLIALVHCCASLVLCAPLQKPQVTRAAAERALSLANKILGDIPAVHELCASATGLTLSSKATHLEYLSSEFGIPAAPVLKSEDLTLDESLSRMVSGLDLHHGLLLEVRELVSSSKQLNDLVDDVRDLSAQLQQMQQASESRGASSRTSTRGVSAQLSQYKLQVFAHLSFQQLRSFTQDVFRGLRRIAASTPLDPQ